MSGEETTSICPFSKGFCCEECALAMIVLETGEWKCAIAVIAEHQQPHYSDRLRAQPVE